MLSHGMNCRDAWSCLKPGSTVIMKKNNSVVLKLERRDSYAITEDHCVDKDGILHMITEYVILDEPFSDQWKLCSLLIV